MDNLSVRSEEKSGVMVVIVSGRVDSETTPLLEAELTKAADWGAKLVLDLKGVEYISSAGIRAIVKVSQTVEQNGGAVKMASAPELVTSIFYTVGIVDKIKSYATVDEAVASF